MVFIKLKVILHMAKNYSKHRDVAPLKVRGVIVRKFERNPYKLPECHFMGVFQF